jgi:hypothetical protein
VSKDMFLVPQSCLPSRPAADLENRFGRDALKKQKLAIIVSINALGGHSDGH